MDGTEVVTDTLARWDNGIYYRPGTTDEDTVALVRNDYKLLRIDQGDVVLDLGANIGLFCALAARRGASSIIAVEPEDENYSIMLRNVVTNAWPVIPFHAAAGGEEGYATLYVSQDGKGRDNHSLHTKGRKIPQTCRVIPVEYFLENYRPNVVKCDIEYGEYDFLATWAEWPDYVKRLAVELHLQKGYRERGAMIADWMTQQGFQTLRPGKFNTNAWHTICVWERP